MYVSEKERKRESGGEGRKECVYVPVTAGVFVREEEEKENTGLTMFM